MDFQPLQHLMRGFAKGGHNFHQIPGAVELYGDEYDVIGHRLDIHHKDPLAEDHNDPQLARAHSYLPLLSTQHESVDDVDFAEHSLIPNIVKASTVAAKHGKEWETHPTTGNLLLPVRMVTHQNGRFAVHDKYLPHDTSQTLEHILAHGSLPPSKSLGETLDNALKSEIGVNYSIPPELDHKLETDPESVHRDLPELWSPFDMHGAIWKEMAGSPHIPRMSWQGLPHHVIINQDHFMGGNMAYHTQTERLHNLG